MNEVVHSIYNLESEPFELLGYRFARVPDYQDRVKMMFRKQRITGNLYSETWSSTRDRNPGSQAHTFNAQWVGEGPEPIAKVVQGVAPAIFDICLLWSLWGDDYVCTGRKAIYESPTYSGESPFRNAAEIRVAIDKAWPAITDSDHARSLALYPVLFLIQESFKTEFREVFTLIMSPALECTIHAPAAPVNGSFLTLLGEDEKQALEKVRAEMSGFLEPHRNEKSALWRNVLGPMLSNVARMGSPGAVEHLIAFLRWTPALRGIRLSDIVVESNARAFNRIRNAVVHGKGIPESVTIEFQNGRKETIRCGADRDQALRAGAYYAFAFRNLLQLHFIRMLGVDGCESLARSVAEFFETGLYNGHDWIEEAFMNRVDIRKG